MMYKIRIKIIINNIKQGTYAKYFDDHSIVWCVSLI